MAKRIPRHAMEILTRQHADVKTCQTCGRPTYYNEPVVYSLRLMLVRHRDCPLTEAHRALLDARQALEERRRREWAEWDARQRQAAAEAAAVAEGKLVRLAEWRRGRAASASRG